MNTFAKLLANNIVALASWLTTVTKSQSDRLCIVELISNHLKGS